MSPSDPPKSDAETVSTVLLRGSTTVVAAVTATTGVEKCCRCSCATGGIMSPSDPPKSEAETVSTVLLRGGAKVVAADGSGEGSSRG